MANNSGGGMNRVEALFEQYRQGQSQYIRGLKGMQEEDEILDFKRLENNRVPLTDSDKKNISEMISAFANNCGGLIVLGVDARPSKSGPDVVQEFYPITGLKSLHTSLLSVVPQITQGGQINVAYEPIDEGADTGFLVMYVPATEGEPVRATATRTNQYYVRNGATSLIMSHSQLSDMFGRRPQAKLEVVWRIQKRADVFDIVFGLRNVGRAIAKYPAMRFLLNESIDAGQLGVMDVYQGGPFRRETTDFPEAILYKGSSDQFIHIASTEWIARYMTKCGFQSQITKNFVFDINVLCEGMYTTEQTVITTQQFKDGRDKAQYAKE